MLGRLTVANEMLSLHGSIQDDPFSPTHVPIHVAQQETPQEISPERDTSPHENGVDGLVNEEKHDSSFDLGTTVNEKERKMVKTKKEKKKKRKSEKDERQEKGNKTKRKRI